MKQFKSMRFLTFAILAGFLSPLSSMGNVSLRNGNFFVGYTDIVYPGGFQIDRVYNSKSNYKGMFGWGWGNDYEVFLKVSADGSVVAHEFGGGAENRFSPVAMKDSEIDKAVESIAEVAQKVGVAGTTTQFEAYKKKLRTDATFRNSEWEKFLEQGKLKPRQLPTGTQFISNRFSYQYITKVANGYVRNSDTGKVESFDENGRLQKISDKNGNTIEFTYGKDGHLQKVVDNFNRKMFFEFNSSGLLTKIDGENAKKAEYRYNPVGELVYSKDVDGNTFTYSYDKGRHNMVKIGYRDKTSMEMTYYGQDKFENIKSVKDRDGTLAQYTYEFGSGKGVRAASVSIKNPQGKVISTNKYEYHIKNRPDGEEWTAKMVTIVDGERTETTYNEAFGLPELIKRGNEETSFKYDERGHVVRKETPSEVTELQYDNKAGKVSKVVYKSKLNPKDSNWSEFQYDKKGNLQTAKDSNGKAVKLVYDANGRIMTMIDQNKRQISFKYNENSKPIEITDPSLGTITVTYGNSGEIKKVDSTAGRKIAAQVSAAFQSLLDIIRPAGVTLSM